MRDKQKAREGRFAGGEKGKDEEKVQGRSREEEKKACE